MKIWKPEIKLGQHVFTCGQTGCGKTVGTQYYLAGFPNVIIFDTKGLFDWSRLVPDVPVFTRLNDLMKFKEGKAIYRPDFSEMNKEFYEAFFEWIYKRGNCWVDCDELMSFCDNLYAPFWLKAIYTRGRERNTSVWGCTQRPKTIPLICISESTHFFIYSLKLEADRKRIMEVIPSEKIMQHISRDSHQFWYYNDTMDSPVLAKLKLQK